MQAQAKQAQGARVLVRGGGCLAARSLAAADTAPGLP